MDKKETKMEWYDEVKPYLILLAVLDKQTNGDVPISSSKLLEKERMIRELLSKVSDVMWKTHEKDLKITEDISK